MASEAPKDSSSTMRIDRYLWFSRLTKTRDIAQRIATKGTLRIDGRRIDRAHAIVRVGSVLAWPWNGEVRIVRVEQLPDHRCSASEAATLYSRIESTSPKPVDADGRAA